MPLKVSDGMGAWIDDFKKSDAPQFKGKSAEERREMAVAAYMSAKNGPKNEDNIDEISSNKLGDYMRKSAQSAAKPGQSARTQDKRIAGQSMADKKIRKKMGYSSTAKVPAGMNKEETEMKSWDELREAMKPAQQAAIAIAKKEKGEKPKNEEKVTCPECEGKGCDHCDNKGYHMVGEKKMDPAAMKRAMDAFKKRGGKITKVAPGKAAGYHGKDDPGKGMHGMMDKGDTKNMPKKKFMGSMK